MVQILIVALGGGVGAVMRHLSTLAALRLLGPTLPWGTLFVNVAGSVLMGLVVEALARRYDLPPEIRLLLTTGFLGGFTTFSAYALDTAVMIERGAFLAAGLYAFGSVGLAVGGLFLGLAVGRHLF